MIKDFHDKALRGGLRETSLRKEKKKCIKSLTFITGLWVKNLKCVLFTVFHFLRTLPYYGSLILYLKIPRLGFIVFFFFFNALYTLDEVLPRGLFDKQSTYHHRRHWFSTWVGKIPGDGNGSPLQYSCLENPMDTGAGGLLFMGSQSQVRLSTYFRMRLNPYDGWWQDVTSGWHCFGCLFKCISFKNNETFRKQSIKKNPSVMGSV